MGVSVGFPLCCRGMGSIYRELRNSGRSPDMEHLSFTGALLGYLGM